MYSGQLVEQSNARTVALTAGGGLRAVVKLEVLGRVLVFVTTRYRLPVSKL